MTTVERLKAVGEAIRAGAIVTSDDGWYVKRDWIADVMHLLPEDPWLGGNYAGEYVDCDEIHPVTGYPCIRLANHRGRNLAALNGRVVAVWGQR